MQTPLSVPFLLTTYTRNGPLKITGGGGELAFLYQEDSPETGILLAYGNGAFGINIPSIELDKETLETTLRALGISPADFETVLLPKGIKNDGGIQVNDTVGAQLYIVPEPLRSSIAYRFNHMSADDRIMISVNATPISGTAQPVDAITVGEAKYQLKTEDRTYYLAASTDSESGIFLLTIFDEEYAGKYDLGLTAALNSQSSPPLLIIADFKNGMLGINGIDETSDFEDTAKSAGFISTPNFIAPLIIVGSIVVLGALLLNFRKHS